MEDKIVDVSCGAYHTLFLTKDGNLYACGLSRDDRFPGGGQGEKVKKPTKIGGPDVDGHKIVGISAGKKHNLIISESK